MTVVEHQEESRSFGYACFGCTAHASRGPAICPNDLSVSERRASRTLVDAVKDKLDWPELVERFMAVFRQRASALQAESPAATEETDRRLRDSERRVANLTESLAKLGWSEALASRLREEEAQLARLGTERTAAAKQFAPRVLPQPAAIAGHARNLFALLETDPVLGRENPRPVRGPGGHDPGGRTVRHRLQLRETAPRVDTGDGGLQPFVLPDRRSQRPVRKVAGLDRLRVRTSRSALISPRKRYLGSRSKALPRLRVVHIHDTSIGHDTSRGHPRPHRRLSMTQPQS